MNNLTNKLKMAMRNARFEAQRRTDEAGVRDDLADDFVVYRKRRNRRGPMQDIRNIINGENDDD